MRTKRLLTGAAAGVAALALAGGCAQQVKRLEPALELRAAAEHLAAAKQVGFTLKVTGSADDLIKSLKQQAAKDNSRDNAWTSDDTDSLRTLLNSSVTVAYDLAGAGTDDDRMQLSATVDGVEGTELRVVGRTLYAKAPVTELAKKFGAGVDDISSMRTDATAITPTLGALFDGGWVSLDVKDAADLPGASLGLPTPDADTAKTLAELKTSASNLFAGATIVRDTADPKHLVVTSSTTKAYAEMKRLVTAVSGANSMDLADEIGDAPKDRPIVLDLWIDNEKLTALEVNLLQFVDGTPGRAALRLDMTTGAPITAPQGASKIDPSALTASQSGTGNATDEAEMLGYEVLDRAQQDGGKPANYLKAAIADLVEPGTTTKIVRRGVAEVTVNGTKACLKLPTTYTKEPTVTPGACS
jgi:hypothetical protein